MITKIKKIKNMGIFGDYTQKSEGIIFKRYNLIYGENGSGKTTLTRLLAALNTGVSADYHNLEYSIETSTGTIQQNKKYETAIRVFNSDYIKKNIGDLEGVLDPILIVGEEQKELALAIKNNEDELKPRTDKIETLNKYIAEQIKQKNIIFSSIAKTIGEATSGTAPRNYRKPDAESAYLRLPNPQAQNDDSIARHQKTIRQEMMPDIPITSYSDLIDRIKLAYKKLQILTKRTAQSEVISRLSKNYDLASWVNQGHTAPPSGAGCEKLLG